MPQSLETIAAQAGTRTPEQARADIAAKTGLPPGKTRDEALQRASNYARVLWSRRDWLARPEDERIEELQRFCIQLFGGDAKEGHALATDAMWGI